MGRLKSSVLLFFLFLGQCYGVVGITNYITIGEAEGKAVEKIIERKQKKLLFALDVLTVELKAKLDADKERYRIVSGIKMMTKQILREKMRTYESIKKARMHLEAELRAETVKRHAAVKHQENKRP